MSKPKSTRAVRRLYEPVWQCDGFIYARVSTKGNEHRCYAIKSAARTTAALSQWTDFLLNTFDDAWSVEVGFEPFAPMAMPKPSLEDL